MNKLEKFIGENKIKYYKASPDKFFEDFYGVKLYWYQKIFIKMYTKYINIRRK